MLRITLPVLDNEQIEAFESLDILPDVFFTENFVFYSIDYVGPYNNFKNLCVVGCAGAEFVIGKSFENVVEQIDKQKSSLYVVFSN